MPSVFSQRCSRFLARVIGVGVAVSLLAACSTSPGRFSDTPETLDEEAFAGLVGALRPQTLNPGQCGLFLWSRTEERDLVFFGLGNRSEGRMMIAQQEVVLPRVAADGGQTFGQFPRQTFRRSDLTVNLVLEIQPNPNMTGGAVVPRGSLRLEQTGGWNLVLPVGGLIACQPDR